MQLFEVAVENNSIKIADIEAIIDEEEKLIKKTTMIIMILIMLMKKYLLKKILLLMLLRWTRIRTQIRIRIWTTMILLLHL